jgi:hypothetical protein
MDSSPKPRRLGKTERLTAFWGHLVRWLRGHQNKDMKTGIQAIFPELISIHNYPKEITNLELYIT